MFNLRLPCLLEKSIEWVLDKLIASLFAENHVITLLISDDNLSFRWLMSGLWYNIVVSSAKSMNFSRSEQLTMSFIYNKKKSGPRVEPWGTPMLQILVRDLNPLAQTKYLRSLRKLMRKFKNEPLKP